MPKKNALETTGKDKVDTQFARFRQGGYPQPDEPGESRSSNQRLDGYIMLNTDGMGYITRINSFGEAFLGIPETDILGKNFAYIAQPDNFEFGEKKKHFLNHFFQTTQTNDFAEFETRHASGTHRRVAWTRSAVRNSDAAFGEMLYIGIDVQGASENIHETMRPNESGICEPDSHYTFLEKHIENSNAWAWEMNADAEFCYVSPGIEKLLGYSRDEMLGVPVDSFMNHNGYGRFRQAIDEAVKAGHRQFKVENQFRCKSSELIWLETVGVIFCDENNVLLGARGLSREIGLEVSLNEELILKESEYRYLLDNTQVALMMLNEEGTILNINQTGAKMHGKKPPQMVGRKLYEFVRESERDAVIDALSKTYRSAKGQKEHFVDVEPHIIRVDNPKGPRYLRFVPKAIKIMENDKMVGILNTVLDITESHMLQKELEERQEQLQRLVDERTEEIKALQEEMLQNERLTTLGRLTSTVSHEIRNPLGTINSSFYIINERLKGRDERVGKAVERGFRAIRRCDGIIEEMLDFTRTKGLEKRIVDISSWLEKLLDEVRVPGNVSLIRLIDSGLSAPVDAGRLHRCVLNVLENALTATRDENEGIIRISARMYGGRLEISIKDNGPGVSKKMQNRVFDPLYSTKQNGIGMGLPVCRQIMELHDGSISLRSDKGKGTTVILRLSVPRKA